MHTHLRKWKHRLSRHLRGLGSAWRYSALVAGEEGLSRFRLLGEAVLLAARGRMAPDTYFYYRLFDPKLSTEQKRRYLPESPRANARLWSRLTPSRFRCLYDNKVVFHHYFTSLGLPLAGLFGVFDPAVGRTAEGESLRTEADLASLLRRLSHNGFVFKPAEGLKGHQVLVFTGPAPDDPDTFLTLSGERYDAARMISIANDSAALEIDNPWASLSTFLIEERIRPHRELAEIHRPHAVHRPGPHHRWPRRTAAHRRVGLQAAVEAGGSGPSACMARWGVGWIRRRALSARVGHAPASTPPPSFRTRTDPSSDTGFPAGSRSRDSRWRPRRGFPWARAIGWDIAISDRGPILIEGNERWSPSLMQIPAPYGLMEGELEALLTFTS